MIRVAAETLPEELLALIAKVEAGDVILLERDGVVIARIEPPPPQSWPRTTARKTALKINPKTQLRTPAPLRNRHLQGNCANSAKE